MEIFHPVNVDQNVIDVFVRKNISGKIVNKNRFDRWAKSLPEEWNG